MIALPKKDVEKQVILQKIAKKFEKDREYSEDEVNDILKACKVEDHALFRRELVNFNYFGKDSYRGVYWLKKDSLSEAELKRIKSTQEKIEESQ